MGEFRMPSLGADMQTGTLLEWTVAPGDRVHRGDLVAAVETEKSTIDVECFEDGVVEELLVPPGTTVAVGTPLARIGTAAAVEAPVPAPPPTPHATPPVRHFAKQVGIDLATVRGTGHGGAVTHADVSAALAAATPTRPAAAASGNGGRPDATVAPERWPAPPATRMRVTPYARRLARERGIDVRTLDVGDSTIRARDLPTASPTGGAAGGRPRVDRTPADRMRAAIAALMSRASAIPHYHVSADIELGALLERLHAVNQRLDVAERVVPAALLLRAAARAAQRVGELNGTWTDDRFHPAEGVDLGVVVSLRGGGLLVPTIARAHELDTPAMMRSLREVVERARTGHLRSSDTRPASITVTDLGEFGARSVQGVLFPPQAALVGIGAVSRRPWVVDDEVRVRPVVSVTLTGDHRASDGLAGSRFLRHLDTFLHDPEELP